MNYWLFKSETDCFSVDDLAASPDATSSWDGVRNYQARNFMRTMRKGDLGFFYHSGKNPEIAGIVEVVRESHPDHTAWDPENDHYDPASTPDAPRWDMVDVRLVQRFVTPLPRAALKGVAGLEGMELLKKGSRLSVQPVTPEEFAIVRHLAEQAQNTSEGA
ncbi:EVE domain-containing protein [Nitratidesulfovibrio vulgaris]|uniref:EVE domain-containing protein n=2 Tax=Nitratidesulfovibrio vulgaris TaxID=881 RepID=Q729D5_NITV2|nr:EVE domain-containing protein [Nitratidesulfovibrio vulgaris]GEB81043.1 EVE domain-containing protein [Desulfovibrio desulfuricans]HBW17320.1 EVE domain-containing protein [Desulfovibrio sp.]AAS96889.1 conserved hypothetical protein [Nitratidesulfovibrio vulgaris str. Hildenborough]ABM27836.1 protein of unknown function DUF55 [Nitratidesulfovibrio vulgaris DP4]ADP87379.1 protein of unknown function DUF55 [Nitratidesulfovibrio vulgaris RCH1]